MRIGSGVAAVVVVGCLIFGFLKAREWEARDLGVELVAAELRPEEWARRGVFNSCDGGDVPAWELSRLQPEGAEVALELLRHPNQSVHEWARWILWKQLWWPYEGGLDSLVLDRTSDAELIAAWETYERTGRMPPPPEPTEAERARWRAACRRALPRRE